MENLPPRIILPRDTNLWPSGRGVEIGYVAESIMIIAEKLRAPLFIEDDGSAVILWLKEIGPVSIYTEGGDLSGAGIVVDSALDPLVASEAIGDALGSILATRWPAGSGL